MNIASQSIENTTDDPLSAVTHEELVQCARLLAVSVAHHRAKFGVVPITTSGAQLGIDVANTADIALEHAAHTTLTEALDLVRRRAAEQVRTEPAGCEADTHVPVEEKRRQMRISVNTAVQVSDVHGQRVCPSTLRNISWGGAAIRCDEMPTDIGGRVRLLLPVGHKRLIAIEAAVLRESIVEGEREYGLRFDSLDPEDEDRLLEVLQILIAAPDHERRRSEVRLVQRLEVEYGDAGEFQATLEDISASGLMLTVPDPLELDQSLLISLSSADTPFGLNLRARVVHQTLIEESDIDMYRVGLRFEHPDPRLRERVSTVINELAIMRPQDLPVDSNILEVISNEEKTGDADPE